MLSLCERMRNTNMFNKSVIVCVVGLLMSSNVSTAEEKIKQPIIPGALMDGQSIEPDVNIIQKKDRTIKEYRLYGRLYMIKITPTLGFPYFLTDTDGDGSLETTQHELDSGLLVPSWVLLKW